MPDAVADYLRRYRSAAASASPSSAASTAPAAPDDAVADYLRRYGGADRPSPSSPAAGTPAPAVAPTNDPAPKRPPARRDTTFASEGTRVARTRGGESDLAQLADAARQVPRAVVDAGGRLLSGAARLLDLGEDAMRAPGTPQLGAGFDAIAAGIDRSRKRVTDPLKPTTRAGQVAAPIADLGATVAPYVASGGLLGAVGGAAASAGLTAAQAANGREGSTVGVLAEATGSPTLRRVADSGAGRVAADVALDVALSGLVPGLRAGGRALRRAGDVSEGVVEAGARGVGEAVEEAGERQGTRFGQAAQLAAEVRARRAAREAELLREPRSPNAQAVVDFDRQVGRARTRETEREALRARGVDTRPLSEVLRDADARLRGTTPAPAPATPPPAPSRLDAELGAATAARTDAEARALRAEPGAMGQLAGQLLDAGHAPAAVRVLTLEQRAQALLGEPVPFSGQAGREGLPSGPVANRSAPEVPTEATTSPADPLPAAGAPKETLRSDPRGDAAPGVMFSNPMLNPGLLARAVKDPVVATVAGAGAGALADDEHPVRGAMLGGLAGIGLAQATTLASGLLAARRAGVPAAGAGAGLGARLRAAAGRRAPAYVADPDVAQVLSTIARGDRAEATRSGLLSAAGRAYTAVVDELYPLRQLGRTLGGPGAAGEALSHEVTRAAGWRGAAEQRLRDGLRPMLRGARGHEEGVMALAKARRALELRAQGLDKTDVPDAVLQATASKLGQVPEVQAGADALEAYYRELLDYQAANGVLDPATHQALVASGQHYTPFVREFSDATGAALPGGAATGGGGGGRFVNRGAGVRQMGEGRAQADTVDPFE